MEFQFLATFTSRTASCSSAASHQSYSTIRRLLPSNTPSEFNLQPALLLVPRHPHALVPPLVPLSMLRSLGEALHIYTLCRLFTIFFQTVSHGDAIIPLFLVMSHTARSPTLEEVTNNYCRPSKTVLRALFSIWPCLAASTQDKIAA